MTAKPTWIHSEVRIDISTSATAKAAGAKIIFELVTMDYGGKAFTCRDPEGHIWNIGEYDPWQQHGS